MSEWSAELDRYALPDPGSVARLLMRLGILASNEASARYSRVDAELDAIDAYRRSHQAHPREPGLDPLYDAVWIAIVEVPMG